ncbi:hypothetical protein A3L04_02120 [Thermococcus chitonophagus]|uniref:S-layer protein outer domain-containing protein n=1 Tax=Thermococcus chitonophagus TaxID=54262 RepID=A0A160VR31_9EURY|nr:DUF4932 domain-containing protein [Thermococcus chitonophagus]ASJ15956.1 hypothetical protein A3L04_02120 [Thermococcus chitonophagus]CUX77200.1 hypothetical protein CHITON_0421 [Thermococcus chitonophagus]
MKKEIFVVLVTGIVLFSFVTPVQAKVTVEVNPNLELFSVVYILAFGWKDPFVIAPWNYTRDVLEYFFPYRNHEAVKYIRELFANDSSYIDRDYAIAMFVDNKTLVEDLPEILEKFARDSNFTEFYLRHRKEYENLTSIYRPYLNITEKLHRELFGRSFKDYKVELSYSLYIHPHSGFTNTTAYYVGGILHAAGVSRYQGICTIFHEFTHPLVDQLVTNVTFKNVSYYLSGIKTRYPKITSLDPMHFSNYTIYFKEGITESVAEFMCLNAGVPRDFVRYRNLLYSLFLTEDFLEEIERFNKTKHENETLFDYLPVLIRHMESWATEDNVSRYFDTKLPILGEDFAESVLDSRRIVIIYGTRNPDKSGILIDQRAAERLKYEVKEMFKSTYGTQVNVTVKFDKAVIPEDLRQNVILVGGPVSNNITRELNDVLPIKFVKYNGTWCLVRNPSNVTWLGSFRYSERYFKEVTGDFVSCAKGIGVIERIRNPWNRNRILVVVAGVDRIGTARVVLRFPYGTEGSYMILGKGWAESGFYVQPH